MAAEKHLLLISELIAHNFRAGLFIKGEQHRGHVIYSFTQTP
jgi:hypothetical protein